MELIQPNKNTHYLHGSKKEFPVGFVLTPQSDGYVHANYGDASDAQIRVIEKLIEKYRPSHMISRYQSVFLAPSIPAITQAGGDTTHIYEIEPIGECEKACLWWYAEFETNIVGATSIHPATAKKWALNYWNATPPPPGKPIVYEYRCREAKIIKILR